MPGTDIYIVGLSYVDNWHSQIKKAVLDNFFFAINKGKLVVQVEEEVITSESLGRFMEEMLTDQESPTLGTKYYESITSEERRHFYEEDFMGLGEIELFLLPDAKMPKKVAMVRETGMVIFDKGHFRTPIRFAGVFHAKGKEINGLLRKLEPPRHNRWIPKRHPDNPKYADKVIKKLYEWITEKVRELASQEYLEEIDVEELSRFLPDDLDEADNKNEDDSKNEFNDEPIPDVDVSLRRYSERTTTTTYVDEEGSGGEGDSSWGEGDEGEGDGFPTEDGNSIERSLAPGGGESSGGDDEGMQGPGGAGESRSGALKPINLSKVRSFVVNPEGTKYQISFVPEFDGEASVDIKIVGEVGADRANIKSACFIGSGRSFDINNAGQISSVLLSKGERASFIVELHEDGKRSLEISAYAN